MKRRQLLSLPALLIVPLPTLPGMGDRQTPYTSTYQLLRDCYLFCEAFPGSIVTSEDDAKLRTFGFRCTRSDGTGARKFIPIADVSLGFHRSFEGQDPILKENVMARIRTHWGREELAGILSGPDGWNQLYRLKPPTHWWIPPGASPP